MLKMTSNSEESYPVVDMSYNALMPIVGNSDGLKELRGFDCNATRENSGTVFCSYLDA